MWITRSVVHTALRLMTFRCPDEWALYNTEIINLTALSTPRRVGYGGSAGNITPSSPLVRLFMTLERPKSTANGPCLLRLHLSLITPAAFLHKNESLCKSEKVP